MSISDGIKSRKDHIHSADHFHGVFCSDVYVSKLNKQDCDTCKTLKTIANLLPLPFLAQQLITDI